MGKEQSRPDSKGNQTRLRRSILAAMVAVPLIPFVLAMGVSFYYFTTALEQKTLSNLERIVMDHREMIQSFLTGRQADLELVRDVYTFEQLNTAQTIDQVFSLLKNRSSAFMDLGLFDSTGIHLKYSGPYPLTGKTYGDETWFKRVMAQGSYISDVFLGYRRVPHFIIAVLKKTGNRTWVLRATIDTHFFDRLVSGVRVGESGDAYILNQNGIAQNKRESGGINIMEKHPEFDLFPLPKTGIQTFIHSDLSAKTYLYAATWMKNRDWLLLVRQEKKDAFAALYKALGLNLIIMAGGGGVIIGVAVITTGRILTRINQLGTEKKSLGDQLIRAVKLAEIGEMATGFAHEINNPLQIIKGEHALVISLLEEMPAPTAVQSSTDRPELWTRTMEDINESLDQIRIQVERCAKITHAILKFGRKDEIKLAPLNPGQIIPDIVRLIQNKARVNGIELSLTIPQKSPGFMADPSQFQQVLLNLLNNAMDAVAHRHGSSGGKISIETQERPGSKVEISITDNGAGIDRDHIDKIFSPFFTTKPVGKGTGLGLSVCYGIIKNFGGTISLKSQKDSGTSFYIELPACRPNQEEEETHDPHEDHAG